MSRRIAVTLSCGVNVALLDQALERRDEPRIVLAKRATPVDWPQTRTDPSLGDNMAVLQSANRSR
jgi:hypothetical protein